jgi:hypothetical protein
MATDTANLAGLLHDARSFDNESKTDLEKIKLALLREILLALNPMADVSSNALIESINCLQCLRPYQIPLIQIALLQQIALVALNPAPVNTPVQCGVVDPVLPPVGACGIYYRTDNGGVWVWDGAVWQPVIGP